MHRPAFVCVLLLAGCNAVVPPADVVMNDTLNASDASDTRVSDTVVTDATADAGTEPYAWEPSNPCGNNYADATWNCQPDGRTLRRTVNGVVEMFSCPKACLSMPYGFHDVCAVRDTPVPAQVNANTLAATQAAWMHYVGVCVVPRMQGTRTERLVNASRVAWWSLKEGLLDLRRDPNAVGFSLCHMTGGDQRIGPLAVCAAGQAWQVGASAIQVPCCSLATVETVARTAFPELSLEQVLSRAAVEAGYGGTATETGIVAATDSLRASWLLRASPVGFTLQAPAVTAECVTDMRSWCYGTGWATSASYAPDRPSALRAMTDVQAILDAVTP